MEGKLPNLFDTLSSTLHPVKVLEETVDGFAVLALDFASVVLSFAPIAKDIDILDTGGAEEVCGALALFVAENVPADAGKDDAGAETIFSDGSTSLMLEAVNALKNEALDAVLLLLERGTLFEEALVVSVPEKSPPEEKGLDIEGMLWLCSTGAEDDENGKGLYEESESAATSRVGGRKLNNVVFVGIGSVNAV